MAFEFKPEHFARADESADSQFYSFDRLVTHIDEGAIRAVGELYAELIPPDAVVLDLMSSWVSHFLPGREPRRLIGLGMNAAELAQNRALHGWLVHDLNRAGTIPFRDSSFDAVVCAVSVQYLTRPVRIFTEMWRVLRPGGWRS